MTLAIATSEYSAAHDELRDHEAVFPEYGGSQCLDHETGKIRCIQTDAVFRYQSAKCSCESVRSSRFDVRRVSPAFLDQRAVSPLVWSIAPM